MHSASITDPVPSPKLINDPSFIELPDVKLMKHNSAKAQADIMGNKAEADDPFFNKVTPS